MASQNYKYWWSYHLNFGFLSQYEDGVWQYEDGNTGNGLDYGFIELPLPVEYDIVIVEYREAVSDGSVRLYINNIERQSITGGAASEIFTTNTDEFYVPGHMLTIQEDISIIGADLKITFKKNPTKYSVNFPENTTLSINDDYQTSFIGVYNVIVGSSTSYITNSTSQNVFDANVNEILLKYSMQKAISAYLKYNGTDWIIDESIIEGSSTDSSSGGSSYNGIIFSNNSKIKPYVGSQSPSTKIIHHIADTHTFMEYTNTENDGSKWLVSIEKGLINIFNGGKIRFWNSNPSSLGPVGFCIVPGTISRGSLGCLDRLPAERGPTLLPSMKN